MGVISLPKTVTRQRRGCYLNPGPTAPESSAVLVHSDAAFGYNALNSRGGESVPKIILTDTINLFF